MTQFHSIYTSEISAIVIYAGNWPLSSAEAFYSSVPFHPSTPFHENILATYQRKQFWYDVNSASTVFRRNILSAKHDTTLDSLSILVA